MKTLDALRQLYTEVMDAPRFPGDTYADPPTDSRLESFIQEKEVRVKRAMSNVALRDTTAFENSTV